MISTTRTAKHSFHGTATCLQFPTANNPGIDRERFSTAQEFINKRTGETLPPEYMETPPSALITCQPTIPSVEGPLKAEAAASLSSVEIEKDWLKCVEVLQGKNTLEVKDIISWAAFHASRQPPLCRPMSIITLLPLLTEPTHSTAMILHAMDLVQKVTSYVNQSHIPVITADQPLFAIAKLIQWRSKEYVRNLNRALILPPRVKQLSIMNRRLEYRRNLPKT